MDYKIEEMKRHPDGYAVARVLSYHSQKEFWLHDRWGSWFSQPFDQIGKRGPMKEPTFDLAAALQAHLNSNANKLKPLRMVGRDNPFVKKKVETSGKPNPFAKKAKKNPFLKKAK